MRRMIAILLILSIPLAVTPPVRPAAANNLQAGIAAWIATGQFDQADILPIYSTIEYRTPAALIGTVNLIGYGSAEAPHLYSHTSGYLLAYYPRRHSIAHLFDWRAGLLESKLDHALQRGAQAVGAPIPQPTYYHFQYPQATTLFMTAQNGSGGLTVSLPLDLTYYEFGLSLDSNTCCLCYPNTAILYLDGVTFFDHDCDPVTSYQSTSLEAGQDHTLELLIESGSGFGGLAVLYGGQPITTTNSYSLALDSSLAALLDLIPPYVSAQAATAAQAAPLAEPSFDLPIFYPLYLPVVHHD